MLRSSLWFFSVNLPKKNGGSLINCKDWDFLGEPENNHAPVFSLYKRFVRGRHYDVDMNCTT